LALGVTVRPSGTGAPGVEQGGQAGLGGLGARVSRWPPLRLARLRCERGSVGVASPTALPPGRTAHGKGDADGWAGGSPAVFRVGRASGVRPGRGVGGRGGGAGRPDRHHPRRAAGLRRQPRPRGRGGVGGDREHLGDRDPAGVPGRSGSGLEPGEDPGDRRGEGEDRQRRRADPGAAAGRGLPASGVAAGRRDQRAASAGAAPRAHRAAAGPG
jgi:hypothetical protein